MEKFLWLFRLLALLLMAGELLCSPVLAQTHEDALGRRVVLQQVPRRVVSLVPSVTEVIYALEADDALVGVTDFCNYPSRARQKYSVGAYNSPSIESIAMLQPDLVIISADMATPAMLQTFVKLQIPVYTVYPRSIAATAAMLRNLGSVFGREQAGAILAAELQRTVSRLRSDAEHMPAERSPRVLICIMIEPLVIAGTDTLPGEMLEVAGGVNVAQNHSRYPMWNIESVLAVDPDIIIVSPHPGTSSPQDFFLRFPQLRAVRNGRVVSVEADWLQRPGPRIIKGLEALHRIVKQVWIEVDEK